MKETSYLTFLSNFFLQYKNTIFLSYIDNKLKYRRTLLGPLWNSLAQLITIVLLSIVWSEIFKMVQKIDFRFSKWFKKSSSNRKSWLKNLFFNLEKVPGDVLMVTTGMAVPADAR